MTAGGMTGARVASREEPAKEGSLGRKKPLLGPFLLQGGILCGSLFEDGFSPKVLYILLKTQRIMGNSESLGLIALCAMCATSTLHIASQKGHYHC